LASLAALAENPERVRMLIHNKNINNTGCYLVRFYLNGVMHGVMVDDRFLYDTQTEILLFSKCRDDEWWVPIVEKAYAKLLGSYMREESSQPYYLCTLLTNAPAIYQYHTEIKD
jgi:hypothetical protein